MLRPAVLLKAFGALGARADIDPSSPLPIRHIRVLFLHKFICRLPPWRIKAEKLHNRAGRQGNPNDGADRMMGQIAPLREPSEGEA